MGSARRSLLVLPFAGAAWGYFIVNATMALIVADAIMLTIAASLPVWLQQPGTLSLLPPWPALCIARQTLLSKAHATTPFGLPSVGW